MTSTCGAQRPRRHWCSPYIGHTGACIIRRVSQGPVKIHTDGGARPANQRALPEPRAETLHKEAKPGLTAALGKVARTIFHETSSAATIEEVVLLHQRLILNVMVEAELDIP